MPEKLKNMFFTPATIGVMAAALMGATAGKASADAGFRKWIDGFYSVAAKSGISRSTYNAVFNGVTTPDELVIERANYQPEFTSKVWDYLDARVT